MAKTIDDILELVDIKKAIQQDRLSILELNKELQVYAKKKAETEKVYRVALAKEIITLREQKLPVTLISDIARGNVANLKFERDLADSMFTSVRDSLKGLQSATSSLQSILRTQEEI